MNPRWRILAQQLEEAADEIQQLALSEWDADLVRMLDGHSGRVRAASDLCRALAEVGR